MAKRKSQSADVALPGLESALQPLNARPGDIDMSDGKTYTAAVLFRDHPNVFRSACQLLFKHGLSERAVAGALMLLHNTVRAIRDMVVQSQGATTDAAAAAFFIKSRAANSRKVVQLRALEALADRLSDEASLEDISTSQLLEIVDAVDKIDGKTEPETKNQKPSEAVIDVDVFDAALDGLNEEKKSAREDGRDPAADRADCEDDEGFGQGCECSTGSVEK
jgi:hypothetical protein